MNPDLITGIAIGAVCALFLVAVVMAFIACHNPDKKKDRRIRMNGPRGK